MSGRLLITGGAGFLGSHLCDMLLAEGWTVLCADNLSTADGSNLLHLEGNKRFDFLPLDVTTQIDVPGPLDAILHFASPASPLDYLRLPIETLRVGSLGTLNMLHLAAKKNARYLLASTSETYGDPAVHPQQESYWGNVNPVGPRAVYDEAKRFAEAMSMAFHRSRDVDIAIVRIFNTYGPRMRRHDGRAIPNFIAQALRGEPITVAGDGLQTRSLCYVDDLVDGVARLLNSPHTGPVNLGNPREITVLDLAKTIKRVCESDSPLVFVSRPVDDPARRRPDISLAEALLGWSPKVELAEGLMCTVEWFRTQSEVRRKDGRSVSRLWQSSPDPGGWDRAGAQRWAL